MQNKSVKQIKIRRVNPQNNIGTDDLLAVEEPLEIQLDYYKDEKRIRKSISVTMRTPGNDAELAVGFLFTEGIIENRTQVEDIKPDLFEENRFIVKLYENVSP